jgi:hypothetical protein
MKKIILSALLAVSFLSFADDPEAGSINFLNNSIGVRFSNMTGYGLSYSRKFAGNYTFMASGIVFYDEYVKGEKDSIIQDTKNIIYDYGFELQRDFFKSETTRVYMLGGLFFSNEENKDEWDGQVSIDEKREIIGCGLGLGVEFLIKSRFALNVDFGYKFESEDGKENGIPYESRKTLLGLGLGLSYKY